MVIIIIKSFEQCMTLSVEETAKFQTMEAEMPGQPVLSSNNIRQTACPPLMS